MKRAPSFGNLPTPIPMLRSSCGSLCYTTVDLQSTIKSPYLIQTEIADTVGKSFGNTSLNALVKRSSNTDVLSARHMDSGLWSCTANGVKISTNAGMKQVNVADYLRRIKIDKPKYVIALADEVSYLSSRKRLEASAVRTSEWLKLMCSKDTSLTAPAAGAKGKAARKPVDHNEENSSAECRWDDEAALVGVALPYHVAAGENGLKEADVPFAEARFREQMQTVLSCGAQAVCVGGLGLGESFAVRARAIGAVKEAIASSSSGAELPVVVQGMGSLAEVLHAVLHGADIVATNLPSTATKLGHAIAWSVQPPGEGASGARKRKLGGDSGAPSSARDGVINLWDERYREDAAPLMPDCQCHACRHHTRRYVRHLLQAHELLGEVLLYAHNQYQVVRLFDVIRAHVQAGTLKQWVLEVTEGQA